MQFRVVVRFRPQTVQILVKNLTGNKFTLDVNKFDSVVQVKAMIEEKVVNFKDPFSIKYYI
jgi:hypothetical protein